MSRQASPFRSPEGSQSLLAKYEVIDWLGEGGMGVVFLVRHRLLGERRVIKMIHPERAEEHEFRHRFLQEARTAIRYRHPHIAQVYDFSAEEGSAYLVMEYIDGVTLQDLLRAHGPIAPEFAVSIGSQVLEALGFLHRNGVIHRDVSTDNIMLCRGGDGRPLIKLIDLGLAKWMDSDVALTAAQVFLGKIRYAPPEQFSLGTSELDPRGDLYSLGIVLYELLTGRYPILGDDASSIIAGHLFHPPRSFEVTDPDRRVPPPLREVVLQALEKERELRPSEARTFLERLKSAVPSGCEYGFEEGGLERLLEGVRTATAARIRRGAVCGDEKAGNLDSPVPTDLGATANIGGDTWLGRTLAAPTPEAAIDDEQPAVSTGSQESLEARGLQRDEDAVRKLRASLAPIDTSPLQAPRRSSSDAGRRWLTLRIAIVALPPLFMFGLLVFRTPRRPDLPSGTKTLGARSSTTSREAEAQATVLSSSAARETLPGDQAGTNAGSRTSTSGDTAADSVPSSQARRVSGSRPSYPEAARAKLAFGIVRLELEVLPSGGVGRIRSIGEPDPDLLAAAREAVADWHFEPATLNGSAISSLYLVDLDFELPEDGIRAGALERIAPPVRLFAVQPEYPDVSREEGVEGELTAELTIDARGQVSAVRIKQGLSPELDRAAAEALRQWKFDPARLGDRAIEATYTVTIRFDLGN